MPAKIYVDGQEGTTGLKIHEYLAARTDIDILKIDPAKRKDTAERQRLLNAADIVFLCLPDAASKEAVALITNSNTRVIDASTAFRTDPAWAYGLPELSKVQREKIRTAKRVANPGCHATGFILAVAPLVQAGLVAPSTPLTCFSLTGYSGGGKKMIAEFEDPNAPAYLKGAITYALKLAHKHLPEMQRHSGLASAPVFTPVVTNVHSGMGVHTFLPAQLISGATPAQIHAALAAHYAGQKFVRVLPLNPEELPPAGRLDITACNNTNRADILVFGHDTQTVVIARFDNLGKGASGAAVQCLNLMLGADESTGLTV